MSTPLLDSDRPPAARIKVGPTPRLSAQRTEQVRRLAVCIVGVLLFTLLTTLGAIVRIPLPNTPVPLTLQTVFVVLSGVALGARLGLASQLLYVALGTAGMPIFANGGSGIAYVTGPTAGYLLGFHAARMLRLSGRDCRTVALEVGMQNGGMATGLAFDVLQSARAAMGSATFGPWSAITASVLASWWRREPSEATSKEESEAATEEA